MEGKELIKKRFGCNLDGYDAQSVVQKAVCAKMDSLMNQYVKEMPSGTFVELGAGTGFMTKYLVRRFPDERWLINDLVPSTESYLSPIICGNLRTGSAKYVWGDAEFIDFKDTVACVVAASVFQWFENLEKFLNNITGNILPGGYLVFSSFGEDNFYQIRRASDGKKGICFPSFDTVGKWVEAAGYEILYRENFYEDMYFGSVRELLEYMKYTGVNGTSDGRWTRREYVSFCGKYQNLYEKNGKVKLTYNPFVFIARKPSVK